MLNTLYTFSCNPLSNPLSSDIAIFIPILRWKSLRLKRDDVACPRQCSADSWPAGHTCSPASPAGPHCRVLRGRRRGSKNQTLVHPWGVTQYFRWPKTLRRSLFVKYSGKHHGILYWLDASLKSRLESGILLEHTQHSLVTLFIILKPQTYHTRAQKAWF